jgi:hypothetical protein
VELERGLVLPAARLRYADGAVAVFMVERARDREPRLAVNAADNPASFTAGMLARTPPNGVISPV